MNWFPGPIMAYFKSLGILHGELSDFAHAALGKLGASEEAKVAVAQWLQERGVEWAQAKILGGIALGYAELESKHPGIWVDAQGSA